MPKLFKNKYRIESRRLSYHDYSQAGYYYITICTQNRVNYFGDVVDNEMRLNIFGKIAKQNLKKLPNHFNNMKLYKYIIMPNHIHLIIHILQSNNTRRDAINRVSSGGVNRVSSGGVTKHKNPMLLNNSLGCIIRYYKGRTTFYIRKIGLSNFAWQRNYYERIIRDENHLENVTLYIMNNPVNWAKDRSNLLNKKV